jgi:hypothetical protein
MVVLALLTLFAVVGISFVYYANAESKSSQLVKEAQDEARPDIDPEMLASFFFGQLIVDTKDDEHGVYSALRGHSLARSIYGFNDTPAPGALPNSLPYNGTGRLHTGTDIRFNNPFSDPQFTARGIQPQDDFKLINYMFFRDDPLVVSILGVPFLRDPERYPAATGPQWRTSTDPLTRLPFRGGFNAPYTYPDLNNMYLAAVKADGTLLTPSFHRDWLFNPSRTLDDQSNLNWYNTAGKYLLLRPRPIDQLTQEQVTRAGLTWPVETPPQVAPFQTLIRTLQNNNQLFPYPEDRGGDVKNLIGGPGGNDSIWMDLGFPVMVAPDGRKYKPLFAPLIVDLDNRVNLNTAGNIRGTDTVTGNKVHAVNQGWGPWSVNLSRVFTQPPNANEWQRLFTGTGQPAIPGRYRAPGMLNGTQLLGFRPHFHGRVDWDEWFKDATNDMPSTALDLNKRLDGGIPANKFSPFVSFDPSSPAPGGTRGWQDGNPGESLGHPSLYNVFRPAAGTRRFPLSDMEALLRFDDTGSQAFTSELLRLLPQCLGAAPDTLAARQRQLVTLRSFDVDRPGVSPWLPLYGDRRSSYGEGGYRLAAGDKYPKGANRVGFPNSLMPGQTGDFAADWRAITACLERIDLNRPLPQYPTPTGGIMNPADRPAFEAAERARQQLAEDIYLRLISVTGAYDPFATATLGIPAPEQINSLRALAQIAVNIVDFIDEDDYMTPFHFGALGDTAFLSYVQSLPSPKQRELWVFGTELPHLVINEAYTEFDTARQVGGQWKSIVRVWVELHNPLHADPTMIWSEGGKARLAPTGSLAQGIYKIVLCSHDALSDPLNPDNPTQLRKPENVLGDPFAPPLASTADFTGSTSQLVQPAAGRPGSGNPSGGNEGYYVVGPGPLGTRQPDLLRPAMGQMSYDAAALRDDQGRPATDATGRPEAPTILLRRLACPYLPLQEDHTQPFYNPYITVDYMEDVNVAIGPPEDPDTGDRNENRVVPKPRIRRENEKKTAGDDPRKRYSEGRREPCAGLKGSLKRAGTTDNRLRALQTNTATGEPNHTFWMANSNALPNTNKPFHWLYHLDRRLVSPMELLQVSAFKPHELTQEFMEQRGTNSAVPYHHVIPWFDQDNPRDGMVRDSHRLYRLFEFLGTRSRAAGLEAPAIPNERIVTRLEVIGPSQLRMRATNPAALAGLGWVTQSGVPVTIRPGDVLVLNKDDRTKHENVRVLQILQPGTGQFVLLLEKPLLKNAPGPVRVAELTTLVDRIPGRININTIWDKKTFYAVCAGSPSNNYDLNPQPDPQDPPTLEPNDSKLIFRELVQLRAANPSVNETNFGIAGTDRPFQSMAVGSFPDTPPDPQFPGRGINDSLFRSRVGATTAQKLFEIWSQMEQDKTHPFQKWQMLTRMFNNFTTRSNVFAVWVTVGFFEVVDDSSRPVKLGAELGRAENRHVRHRMFAIVDRSNLRLPSPIARILPTAPLQTYGPGIVTIPLTALEGSIPIPPRPIYTLDESTRRALATQPEKMDWSINVGDYVIFNYGKPNQETVLVQDVNRPRKEITATFTMPHFRHVATDANIESVSVFVVPGNPGPTERFNPRDPVFSEVVPYLSIID